MYASCMISSHLSHKQHSCYKVEVAISCWQCPLFKQLKKSLVDIKTSFFKWDLAMRAAEMITHKIRV